jgi:DNA-binding transcriptional ArsR family regulator
MPQPLAATDAFTAIAEPCRRDILVALRGGECSVNDLVRSLRVPQPRVSQHLGVLRTVGLVHCRAEGRRRLYRVNAVALDPINDWLGNFERLVNERLDRLDDVLEDLKLERDDPNTVATGVSQ